jgi:hypothetical protein
MPSSPHPASAVANPTIAKTNVRRATVRLIRRCIRIIIYCIIYCLRAWSVVGKYIGSRELRFTKRAVSRDPLWPRCSQTTIDQHAQENGSTRTWPGRSRALSSRSSATLAIAKCNSMPGGPDAAVGVFPAMIANARQFTKLCHTSLGAACHRVQFRQRA